MIPNYNPYSMQNPNYNYQMNQQEVSPFVPVRSELEARNYPVGYGKSVTFKDETAPYIYVKSMGFSQLDKPVFEKFKLTKEETGEDLPKKECGCEGLKEQLEDIQTQLMSVWNEINFLKEKKRRSDEQQYTTNVKSNKTKSNSDLIQEV